MPCPKCKGPLIWKDRSWTACGEDPGHWNCIMCGKVVYQERVGLPKSPQDIPFAEGVIRESEDKEFMSYHLDSKKEEEIKMLLKTDSIREIVAKTGVAFNTISRIRNENFTAEERAELRKRANVKGANRRELKKRDPRPDLQNDGQNIPRIIPSTNSDEKGGQEIMTVEMQVCTNPECPKSNPQSIGEFNKNAARPSGRESRCRTCTTLAQRDYRATKGKTSSGHTGRSRKNSGSGRKKRQSRDPGSVRSPNAHTIPSEAVTLDAQLLRAVKKSAILDFVKNDLPRMIEEVF